MAQGVLKRFCRPAKHTACVKIVTEGRSGCTRSARSMREHHYALGKSMTWYQPCSPDQTMSNVSLAKTTRRLAELKPSKRQQLEKLTTSHLARRLGIQSGILLNRLIRYGFLTLKDGRKYLTPDGRQAGGEEITRRAKGRFVVWPQDLLLKILE